MVDTRAGGPSPSVSKTVIWEAPVILNIRDNFWFHHGIDQENESKVIEIAWILFYGLGIILISVNFSGSFSLS